MLSDSDAACVTTGLAPCLKQRDITAPESNSDAREYHNTQEYLTKGLKLREPNDYKNFLGLNGPSCDELLKTVTPKIAKSLPAFGNFCLYCVSKTS
jgi:hypothetical protein